MDNLIKIELTPEEAEDFKDYRKHKQQVSAFHQKWKEVHDISAQIGYGSFTLTLQGGLPHKINRAMQDIVIGIRL